MLAVLVTLALVLTPSITNFINDSRVARARTDTKTMAAAVIQFYKDNGFFPQWVTANAGGPGTAANRRDLLVSPGNVPTTAAASLWTTGTTDTLANQLMGNTPAYTVKTATNAYGWNGPVSVVGDRRGFVEQPLHGQRRSHRHHGRHADISRRDEERGVGHLGGRQRSDSKPCTRSRSRPRCSAATTSASGCSKRNQGSGIRNQCSP